MFQDPPGVSTPAGSLGPALPFRPTGCHLSHQPSPLPLPLVIITFRCSQAENTGTEKTQAAGAGPPKAAREPVCGAGKPGRREARSEVSRGVRERAGKEPAGAWRTGALQPPGSHQLLRRSAEI